MCVTGADGPLRLLAAQRHCKDATIDENWWDHRIDTNKTRASAITVSRKEALC